MTTITALPAAPTVAPASPTSPAPAGAGADDFAGLVEANLAGRGTPDGAGGTGSPDGDTAEQPDAAAPEGPDPDPTVVLLLSPLALALQAAAGPTAAAPSAPGAQGALALAGAGTTGAAGADADLAPSPAAVAPAPGAGSTVQAAAELAGQAVATVATTDSGTPAPSPSDGPAADAAPPTTPATTGATDPGPTSPSTTSPALGTLTGPAATPVAGTAAATGPTTAPSTRAASVAEQVQLQVTGLASRGDGTHRIRLTLNPESLGDVSIVLTVRRGAVEVTLAAGGQARVALEQSSPELQRLLELAGARSSTVAVRELVTAPTAPTGQGLPGDAWGSGGAGMSGEHPTGGRGGDTRPGRSDLTHGVLPDAPSARPHPGSGSRRTSVDVTI